VSTPRNLKDDPPEERLKRAMWHWDQLYRELIARRMANNGLGRRILINCGGMVCTSFEKHLRQFPGTLLTEMINDQSGELAVKNFLFLDRHPFACMEILSAYRDGFLSQQPPHIAPEVWQTELHYFMMHKSEPPVPGMDKIMGMQQTGEDATDIFGNEIGRPAGGVRLAWWQLFEEPKSSAAAWCVSTLSFVMVVASVTIVCIETLPEVTEHLEAVVILDQVDLYIVVGFTLEYLCRLLLSTNRLHFIQRPLNVIDLVSIVPTWLTLVLQEEDFSWGRLLRVLRVLRVFKLARHSGGLQVLAETAIAARNELFQVLFCFSILVILFAAIVYYAEEQDNVGPAFESIPHSMWWAVITLCTIGYGDMVPTSPLGQLCGGMACVSGVVMVALPISVISSTFQTKYAEHTERQLLAEARLRRKKRDDTARRNEKIQRLLKTNSTSSRLGDAAEAAMRLVRTSSKPLVDSLDRGHSSPL